MNVMRTLRTPNPKAGDFVEMADGTFQQVLRRTWRPATRDSDGGWNLYLADESILRQVHGTSHRVASVREESGLLLARVVKNHKILWVPVPPDAE